MQHPSIVEYLAPQAHEQGIQEGAQETIRENIFEILTIRFQDEDLPPLRPALDEIEDMQRLKQLFQTAMQVETLEDFIPALNKNNE